MTTKQLVSGGIMTPVENLHLKLRQGITIYDGDDTSLFTAYFWRRVMCDSKIRKEITYRGREIDSGYCLDRQAIYDPVTGKPI